MEQGRRQISNNPSRRSGNYRSSKQAFKQKAAAFLGAGIILGGVGVGIGKTVISKGPLTVYQHVTIGGGNGKPSRFDSDGIKRGMPMFMGKTVIYTGAIVVGGIIVSENSIIKAGRVVSEDI